MKLRDLHAGDTGRVIGFNPGSKTYRRKLLAMGLTPGVEFAVIRFAPMGDPVELRVRGSSLSLRKDEAEMVEVEKVRA